MKSNQRKLLWAETFSALGGALVGVFLPFLFGRAFGLNMAQVILWMAGINLGFLLFVYPINRLVRNLSTRSIIRIGFALQGMFLSILALSPNSIFWVVIAAILFVLQISLFWPNWNVASLHSSKDGKRGSFFGHLQMIFVGVNLVAPLLSGFLLDRGWDELVLVVSILMFLLAIFSFRNVSLPDQKLSKFSLQWKTFQNYLWNTKHRSGVIMDGIQGGTLWIMWPIFLGAALGSFTQMGFVIAIAAIAEMISAKVFGHLIDKKSSRKILNFGQWFRIADLGLRLILMWIPSIWTAALVSINAGILGPVFNVSFYSRTCEIAEKAAPRELEWFIAREWVLGSVRFLWLSFASVAVYFWGEMILGWFLIAAAVASVGFRRY